MYRVTASWYRLTSSSMAAWLLGPREWALLIVVQLVGISVRCSSAISVVRARPRKVIRPIHLPSSGKTEISPAGRPTFHVERDIELAISLREIVSDWTFVFTRSHVGCHAMASVLSMRGRAAG